MTNKPKFGAGSMSGEEVESQSEVKKEDTVETATAFAEKTTEEAAESVEAKISPTSKSFGAGNGNSNTSDAKKQSSIVGIFKSQGVSFWIISYVASYVIYSFLSSWVIFFKDANLILFPFTLILFSQLQMFLTGSMNGLARWIEPNFRTNGAFTSGLGRFLWYASKLLFYYIAWGFSFILGIIGIIMIFVTNKKVNR